MCFPPSSLESLAQQGVLIACPTSVTLRPPPSNEMADRLSGEKPIPVEKETGEKKGKGFFFFFSVFFSLKCGKQPPPVFLCLQRRGGQVNTPSSSALLSLSLEGSFKEEAKSHPHPQTTVVATARRAAVSLEPSVSCGGRGYPPCGCLFRIWPIKFPQKVPYPAKFPPPVSLSCE